MYTTDKQTTKGEVQVEALNYARVLEIPQRMWHEHGDLMAEMFGESVADDGKREHETYADVGLASACTCTLP